MGRIVSFLMCIALVVPFAFAQAKEEGAKLPITKVVLYKNGVGYFERMGKVDGDATVALRFKAKDMSDLLKSLTVLDLGKGSIRTISYDSTKTVDQQLAEYTFDLRKATGLPDVLEQMKGAEIAARVADREVKGRLLTVEKRVERRNDVEMDVYYVSILLDGGAVKSYNLSEVTEVTFSDPKLQTEMSNYLGTLFSAHRKDLKELSILTSGKGTRDLFVSYVREQPIWKVSYRIVIEKKEKPLLQAWAIVDNVSEDDWENVQLSLVSGLPVSFEENLYDPWFIQRPAIQVQRETGVGPVMYGGGTAVEEKPEAPAAAAAPAMARKAVAQRARNMAADETLHARLEAGGAMPMAMPPSPPELLVSMAQQATAAVAQSAGALFVYNIKDPVTIKRDRSALLPIVNDRVEGTRVSIYNESVRAQNPMEGVRLKNTTGLTLEGGPVSVTEDNTYAGDALMDTLKADDERYISFAVDLGTRVDTNVGSLSQGVYRVRINRGTMILEYKLVETKMYNLNNIEEREKTVVIEHPYRGKDWTLIEPKKPLETTPTHLRFEVKAPAKKVTAFPVKEERTMFTEYRVSNLTRDQILSFTSQKYIDKDTEAFLLKVAGMQGEIAQLQREVNQLQQRLNRIANEEESNRRTLGSIAGQTEDEKALRSRLTKLLDAALTDKAKISGQMDEKNASIQDKQKQLEDLIAKFTFETKV